MSQFATSITVHCSTGLQMTVSFDSSALFQSFDGDKGEFMVDVWKKRNNFSISE